MPRPTTPSSVIAAAAAAAFLLLVPSAAAAPQTQLSIAVYPQGRNSTAVHHYELRCDPTGGTAPKPARACRVLASLVRPFAPVPAGEVCAQIALGPQEAVVTGRVRGRRVWARLSVRDSCQIERWRRLADVIPGFGRTLAP